MDTISDAQKDHSPIELLLIEDNLADVLLFREALKACAFSCHISVLQKRNDVEVFVRQERDAAQVLRPQLIVLDSGLPDMEPEEILTALRSLPACENIPTIVFSSRDERK